MKLKVEWSEFWGCYIIVKGNGHLLLQSAIKVKNYQAKKQLKDICDVYNHWADTHHECWRAAE